MHSGLNGRFKKSLAHQLDRLDIILDGLADALNGAVADAVRQAVGEATREAVQMAMAQALPQQANYQKTQEHPLRRLLAQAKAKTLSAFQSVKHMLGSAIQKIRQFCNLSSGVTAAMVQSTWRALRSRTLRMGMLLGAVASCLLGIFRKDSKRIWWGTGIVLSTMFLESYVGTIGTLMLGGGVVYLLQQHRMNLAPPSFIARQAA
jgi:cation transport ATPase